MGISIHVSSSFDILSIRLAFSTNVVRMLLCCGRRAQGGEKKGAPHAHSNTGSKTNEHAPEPDRVTATLPSNTPVTQNENLDGNSPQGQTQQEQASLPEDNTTPASFHPFPEEIAFNSSMFMPDPSKKRPSAFELASASYAQATDFNLKDELPPLSEFEEEEPDGVTKMRGKENQDTGVPRGN